MLPPREARASWAGGEAAPRSTKRAPGLALALRGACTAGGHLSGHESSVLQGGLGLLGHVRRSVQQGLRGGLECLVAADGYRRGTLHQVKGCLEKLPC